ncbi:helix-turn-helix domain-containing protein [Oceanicaulis alexandrii]|uniref:helix-turn-helix domain-containing protein n=1 Tax=Oceanicaulis alexandrii TaxID=153233 RepID=UPI0035CEDBE1
MSIQALAVVIESGLLTGLEYRVAISIANHADETGSCWLSYERIADEARSSKSPVIKAIRSLTESEDGLLERVGEPGDGPFGTNNYVLNVRAFREAADARADALREARKDRRAKHQKTGSGGDLRSPAKGGDLKSPPVTCGRASGDLGSPEPSRTNYPPTPQTGEAPDPVVSPPEGDDRTGAVEPKPASVGAKPSRSRTRREGGKGKGDAKSRMRRFKSGPADRLAERAPEPEPDLPAYDHAAAEGALLDAMLGGTGRSNRHAAPWLTPEGRFRFQIVRHPLNGAGVKGLYLVTENKAGFRSTFTGALIHFGFPDTALVSPEFWERAKKRLSDRGDWRSEYERIGADALTGAVEDDKRENAQ